MCYGYKTDIASYVISHYIISHSSLAWPDRFLGAGRYRLQYKRPGAYTASDNALRLKAVWPRETNPIATYSKYCCKCQQANSHQHSYYMHSSKVLLVKVYRLEPNMPAGLYLFTLYLATTNYPKIIESE